MMRKSEMVIGPRRAGPSPWRCAPVPPPNRGGGTRARFARGSHGGGDERGALRWLRNSSGSRRGRPRAYERSEHVPLPGCFGRGTAAQRQGEGRRDRGEASRPEPA